MIRTTITDTDPKSGSVIDVPVDLRKGVQRASILLEMDLPIDSFEIDAHWRFVRRADDRMGVTLDLSTPYGDWPVGFTGYPLDADVFKDDAHIRRGLNTPVEHFSRTLAYLNRLDIKHLREKAERLQPLASE